MPPDPDAVRRWAAAHLATVAARGPAMAGDRLTVPPGPAPPPGPAVLASVTETRTWPTEGRALGVSLYVPGDGRAQLAVAGGSGMVRIWDPETAELLHTLTGHTDAVYTVDWGHGRDGQPLLATRGLDGLAWIWDPRTGEHAYDTPIRRGGNDRSGVVSWGYPPGGRPLLAIGAHDGTWIWDSETGDAVRADDREIYAVSWGFGHRAELLLASAGLGGMVRIIDVDSGQVLQVDTGHSLVRAVAWMEPDGESLRFVTVGMGSPEGVNDATLCLWREGRDGAFTAEAVDLRQGPLNMVSAVPLPDGRALLIGYSEEALFVLDGSTLEVLHAEAMDIGDRGLHNLDWAVMPDGSLMVCATTNPDRVHVWTITLDPPIEVNTPRRPSPLVIPPQDVTPAFEAAPTTYSVRCAVRADGEVIAATWHTDSQLRIWAVRTGSLLHAIPLQSQALRRFAFGHLPDGRLVLATASRNGPDIQLWDPSIGELVATHVHQSGSGLDSVAWLHDPDGRPLLASGSVFDGTVLVQDPESGDIVRALPRHGRFVRTIVEGPLADGRSGLVTCDQSAPARLWDPDAGALLTELSVPDADTDANEMWTAAWGRDSDGRPVIATGSTHGAVRIWDPEAGNVLRTLTGHDWTVFSLIWWDRPGWPSILVSGSSDGTVRIWDPYAGTELARLPGVAIVLHAIDLAQTRDGDLLLVVPAGEQEPGPVRVWRIAAGPTNTDSADPAEYNRAYPAELVEMLLRLGDGGLWLPLGLLADLVTLTSPATEPAGLYDARLAALTDQPGIGRLRDLAADQPGWNHTARTAFAALLTADLDIPEHFTPPPDTNPTNLRHALANTTIAATTPTRWHAPAAGLRQAAAAITDQTTTLLRILGPAACAADPLLPLRLAHHAQQLPALTKRELQLLAPATQPAANGQTAAAGTLAYSPGTTGVTRTGPLTRLLPTQLALPTDMLTVRLAENQLLYRQHRAPTPPAPEPVTIILDTTPPTFGPAGQVLRLAAHLITTTLWKHHRHPNLITLTDPDTIIDLRAPADLLWIWTSATLNSPHPALTAALDTAAGTGHPAVLCTHQHTTPASYTPSHATRLLTTHHPPEQSLRARTGLWHVHLPPRPTREQLTNAITTLVMPHAGHEAYVP